MAKKKAKKRKSVKEYEDEVVKKEKDIEVECSVTVKANLGTVANAMDFISYIQKKYPICSFKVEGHKKETKNPSSLYEWIRYDNAGLSL